MFEEGKTYANRIGTYRVLEMNGPKMKVRYDDGSEAELNVKLQQRIWDNIIAEQEAKQMRRAVRKRSALDARYLIHTMAASVDELVDTSWARSVGVGGEMADQIRPGDRLLFFAIESQAFVAAGTITGVVSAPQDAGHDETREATKFFSVELDAFATTLDQAVLLDAAELENERQVRMLLSRPGKHIPILEDEFEDLAEMLAEHTESDDEDDEDELDDEEEYEE